MQYSISKIKCHCIYIYAKFNWASPPRSCKAINILYTVLDYVWPAARKIKTNFMRRECFYITLAWQEFYGGASPRSPCVSYATVSPRTSSLPRLLRGRQPPEPPWFLRHCTRVISANLALHKLHSSNCCVKTNTLNCTVSPLHTFCYTDTHYSFMC